MAVLRYWDGAAWVDVSCGGGSGIKDFDFASRTAGNITINGTAWADVDTGVDLVVAAAAGDWIGVAISGRLTAGAATTNTFFDIATVVSGSPVNYFGTAGGASDEGLNGLRMADTQDLPLTGEFFYRVQSGDISAGTVTLRLRTRQGVAGNRTFVAGATNPFKWWVENLGPVVGGSGGALGTLSGGYAQVTASQTPITAEVDLTGLTVTVTTVASRRYRITACVSVAGTDTNTLAVAIKEGATKLQDVSITLGATAQQDTLSGFVVLTPSAGAHTYKLTMRRAIGAGTSTMFAAADTPAFILIEDIGAA